MFRFNQWKIHSLKTSFIIKQFYHIIIDSIGNYHRKVKDKTETNGRLLIKILGKAVTAPFSGENKRGYSIWPGNCIGKPSSNSNN